MKKYFLLLMIPFNVKASFISKIAPEYKAYVAYEDKNFATAESVYAQSLEQDPYDAVMNYNLGTALYKQKKFIEAKNHFERSVKKSCEKSLLQEQSLFNLGNSFMQLAEYQSAIDVYEKALEIHADNERTQKNLELARSLLEEQKRKEEEQKKQNEQKKESDQQKDDQSKDKPQDKGQQKDQQGKDDKNDSGQPDKSQGRDQKDGDQQDKKDKDNNGQQQKDQQGKSEQSDSGNEKKDQQGDQDTSEQSGKQDPKNSHDKQHDIDKQQGDHGQKQDLQKSKEEPKLAKEAARKDEKQESDTGANVGDEKKEVALQDQYAAQMTSDPASDDRLNKREAMVLKALSDQENSIQKQLLRMNVSKEGGKHEKNW